MSDGLSTLVATCRHRDEIKRSRFLAIACPVASSEQARSFVREVADLDATHNCWAYRIGRDYRFSDDGEPGGTAGRPILQAIESQDVDGVVVVVTRWYGGIKLGAGGLARAYGGTAAECLRQAERVPIVAMASFVVQADFAELALLKARLTEFGSEVEHEEFGVGGVTMRVRAPASRAQEFTRLVSNLTRGRSTPRRLDGALPAD
ncbi:MAG: YigZ family protein [Rhodanobacter sp.]